MINPCYDNKTKTSCNERHAGCSVTCERWKSYVEVRNKKYDEDKARRTAEEGEYEVRTRVLKIYMKKTKNRDKFR